MRRKQLGRTVASLARTAVPAAGAVISLLAVDAAGIATWGAFVGALVLVNLSAQVANFGSRDHLLREFSREPGAIRVAWQRNVVARAWLLPLGPVLFLASGSDLARTAAMTAWLLGLFVSQSHDAVVAYRRAFTFALSLELASVGLTSAAVLILGAALTPEDLIVVFALVAVLKAVTLAMRFRLFGPATWRLRPDLSEFHSSWPFFLLTFSGAVQARVDLYVVALLLPAAALGAYGVLTNFVLLVQSMAGALLAPVVPSLYRLARSSVLAVAARLFAGGVPLTLVAAATTWLCLETLYGIQLAPLTLIAAWAAMLPCFLYSPLVYLCFREGRQRAVVAASLLGAGIGLMGTLLLAPRLGIAGAMVSAAVAQAAIAGFHVARVLRPSAGRAEATSDALSGM